jgi:competence protein ComEC
LLAAGMGAARLETFYYAADDIGLFTADERALVQLELTLDETPRVVSPAGGQRPMSPRQMARGSVRGILTNDGWKSASGEVVVHVEPPDGRLKAGQVIHATGWLARFSPAMNPGQFDFAEHYRNERLLASFSIRRAENVAVVLPAGFNPLAYAREKARSLLRAGFADANSVNHALLRALLLGDNDPQLRDIQELFVRTGTSHHLSISGMHVAVLGGFVYLLCRLARLSPRVTAWTTLLFVILYGLVALPNPPVVRSVLLCAFVLFGALNRKSADLIQMLALSVFTMLVLHPLDLYDVGFQLSFGTVLGLMLFADRL